MMSGGNRWHRKWASWPKLTRALARRWLTCQCPFSRRPCHIAASTFFLRASRPARYIPLTAFSAASSFNSGGGPIEITTIEGTTPFDLALAPTGREDRDGREIIIDRQYLHVDISIR